MLRSIFSLMRVNQWVKNLFLFVPIFFAGELFNTDKLVDLAVGFVAFSMVSSAVYVLNDIKDISEDRQHHLKSKRPLASGEIDKRTGITILAISLSLGMLLSLTLPIWFTWLLFLYLTLNFAYSFGLKNISILDLILVSFGFIIRIVAGGVIGDIYVTNWLIVMIFLLSLFLVVAKRRDDILEYINSGTILRESIQRYNLQFVNSVLTMLSGIIIVAYIMYTISPEVTARFNTHYLYITSLFVIAGLIRYLQITLVENNSGSPVKLLYNDVFIQITIALWILGFFLIIYLL